jgi:hypothetical protein
MLARKSELRSWPSPHPPARSPPLPTMRTLLPRYTHGCALQRTACATSRRAYHPNVLPTAVSPSAPEFVARAQAMNALVADLQHTLADVRLGGGQKVLDKIRGRGKMLRCKRCAPMGPGDRHAITLTSSKLPPGFLHHESRTLHNSVSRHSVTHAWPFSAGLIWCSRPDMRCISCRASNAFHHRCLGLREAMRTPKWTYHRQSIAV